MFTQLPAYLWLQPPGLQAVSAITGASCAVSCLAAKARVSKVQIDEPESGEVLYGSSLSHQVPNSQPAAALHIMAWETGQLPPGSSGIQFYSTPIGRVLPQKPAPAPEVCISPQNPELLSTLRPVSSKGGDCGDEHLAGETAGWRALSW